MSNASTAGPIRPNGWSKAIDSRHRTLLHRVAAACASAVVFAPIIGTLTTLGWLAAYLLMLGMEKAVVRPARGQDGKPPPGLVGFMCDSILLVGAITYAWVVLPMWFVGGLIGGLCATIYLGAGILQAVINGSGSARVTLLTVLPNTLMGLAIPWLLTLHGATINQVVATTTAVLVFLGICLGTSLRLKAANHAHAQAYALAKQNQQEAEQAVDSRTAYLSMVAHDLRTPITAILTGAQSLKDDSLRGLPMAPQKLAMIEDAGRMMNALLNDLLDHARIEAGAMTLNTQAFDLRRLLAQTARLWAGPIRAKGLKLVIDADRSLPRAVLGDEMRLRQVLNNLLSNAVKFTQSGTITLTASAFQDDNGTYAVTIEVADTGPGMTRDQVSRVFNRFDQTAEDIASRYGGSGLGLSICHDLVTLMDGHLTARSQPGQGTRFTIALTMTEGEVMAAAPVTPPAPTASDVLAGLSLLRATPTLPSGLAEETAPAPTPPDAVPEVEPEPQPATAVSGQAPEAGEAHEAPLRVLVVDDHEINRRAIQLILQPFDCDITSAADGMSALELAATKPFDVIFMDVRMPELDGRETTRRLRAAGGPNLHTPVIAVTADNSPEDVSACLAAGMNAFVAKPLTPATLVATLEQALSAPASHQAAA